MSIPVNQLGTTNIVLTTDNPRQSTNGLESTTINNDKTEVHVGSLGLGTALAVAYDLCNDNGLINAFNVNANSQLTNNFFTLSTTIKSSLPSLTTTTSATTTTNHCRNHTLSSLSDQYAYISSNYYFTNNNNNNNNNHHSTCLTQHSDSYLTPITSSTIINDSPNPTKSLPVNDNHHHHPNNNDHSKLIHNSTCDLFINKTNHHYLPHVNFVNHVCCSQPIDVTCSNGNIISHTNHHNHNIDSNTHISNLSTTLSSNQINSTHSIDNECTSIHQGITFNNNNNNHTNGNHIVMKETTDTNHVTSSTSSSATSIDDSLYQLSEEEMKKIDTS
ncbi:unnamed protein product, partial [Schistosoma turkestanicum]